MTEIAPEMEKAPEKGREKAKAGATFFTLTWWLIIGGVAGMVLASLLMESKPFDERAPIGFALLVPLAIAVVQRTTSDKEITWYKNEARIIGGLIGLIAVLLWY